MEAELAGEFGARATLVKGSGGVFEVRMDDEVIFDKRKTGRFPAEGEISGIVRGRRA